MPSHSASTDLTHTYRNDEIMQWMLTETDMITVVHSLTTKGKCTTGILNKQRSVSQLGDSVRFVKGVAEDKEYMTQRIVELSDNT